MTFDPTNWSHSTVTFNDGSSYSVGGLRFVRGMPKPVHSVAIRKALEGVKGFLIQDFSKPEPVKEQQFVPEDSDPEEADEVSEEKIEEMLGGGSESDDESEEIAPLKKKTVKKKKKVVKKVKKKGGE